MDIERSYTFINTELITAECIHTYRIQISVTKTLFIDYNK